ncbi:UDP-glucose 6-dehydrogenase [Candidatus Woesearchaeota archaeon CG1_02_57_44]|nr:MAG: UDP-glucose 6-dehydrogenase [Candidatus Woesearchaeota archaeon CG1_02_57_44]PIN69259.1 MAG: UDP-glucose 6-dehydrogenase [Candidatus Woesearchaeota archaeon CG11_big_fil_rev_8_21_14_0_20_57_5]
MNVSVSGTGYVGLIQGVGLAKKGHSVTCVDIDRAKVESINAGVPPIYEDGLKELLAEVRKNGFKATDDIRQAVLNSDITFVCVGTPSSRHGEIKLHQVRQVAREIGEVLREKDYHVVVIKSTVVPGTTEGMIELLEEHSGKSYPKDFGVAMNPEFLREGSALDDFFSPDRVVIGSTDKRTRDLIRKLYEGFDCEVVETNFREAEMIKYASNALLATKLSFINEVGNVCKRMGIDTNVVAKGVGLDHRIGPKFLRAGLGFGGSCFPKDVSALMHKATESGYYPRVLRAVLDVNRDQPGKLLYLLDNKLGSLSGKRIAILGLTFKENTDDVRESPSLTIIKDLLMEHADLVLFDPMGMPAVMQLFPQLQYAQSAQHAVHGADAVLLLTEWPQFQDVDYGDVYVLDGKNVFNTKDRRPKNYEGICW